MKNSQVIFFLIIFILNPCTSFFAQDTQGFFIKDIQQKKIHIPPSQKAVTVKTAATIKVTINVLDTLATVSEYLFGNNTNPYVTQIVTEPKLLEQIKKLQPNILRFPGGNISNTYF